MCIVNELLFLPADVQLAMYGQKIENKPIKYFNQTILGYAQNTPLLEKNRWIYVKVPLPTMMDVRSLRFDAIPNNNIIEIRNVQISSGEGAICSGDHSSDVGMSAWIENP